jgi:hypothetical protein
MCLVTWDRAISLYPRATFILGVTLILSQAVPPEQYPLLKARIESYMHTGLRDFSSVYEVSQQYLDNCRYSPAERRIEDDDCWVIHLPMLQDNDMQDTDMQEANQYTNDWAANSWQIRFYDELDVKLVTGYHSMRFGRHFFKSWASSAKDHLEDDLYYADYILRIRKLFEIY